ncbi:hypothetical protein ACQU0X_26865 [Pseudovibrio ascidiaceicola]|uniref:hypothetical protein n=1 Tax=Pseudovibrio ascidiaceicola TaxID=285279 RepID=UPI003D35CEF9
MALSPIPVNEPIQQQPPMEESLLNQDGGAAVLEEELEQEVQSAPVVSQPEPSNQPAPQVSEPLPTPDPDLEEEVELQSDVEATAAPAPAPDAPQAEAAQALPDQEEPGLNSDEPAPVSSPQFGEDENVYSGDMDGQALSEPAVQPEVAERAVDPAPEPSPPISAPEPAPEAGVARDQLSPENQSAMTQAAIDMTQQQLADEEKKKKALDPEALSQWMQGVEKKLAQPQASGGGGGAAGLISETTGLAKSAVQNVRGAVETTFGSIKNGVNRAAEMHQERKNPTPAQVAQSLTKQRLSTFNKDVVSFQKNQEHFSNQVERANNAFMGTAAGQALAETAKSLGVSTQSYITKLENGEVESPGCFDLLNEVRSDPTYQTAASELGLCQERAEQLRSGVEANTEVLASGNLDAKVQEQLVDGLTHYGDSAEKMEHSSDKLISDPLAHGEEPVSERSDFRERIHEMVESIKRSIQGLLQKLGLSRESSVDYE